MAKIVYHGTLSGNAPHTWGDPFHAGTENAAYKRLNDEDDYESMWGDDDEDSGSDLGVAQVHAYEIKNTAPTSRRVWQDPEEFQDPNLAVPETKRNRIYPYTNEVEDRGSTSYVIPSEFVGNHVKYLGVQFQTLTGHPSQESENSVYNAMTIMSGGRSGR